MLSALRPQSNFHCSRESQKYQCIGCYQCQYNLPITVIAARFETSLAGFGSWSLIAAKKEAATPAHFYLVWEGTNDDEFEFPVPYQVAFITLQKLDKIFEGAVPSEPQSRPGFRRYSYKCIMCHAINFVGGTSQFDLNVPRNYSETHTEAEFIQKLSRRGIGGKSCSLAGGENETNLKKIWQYLRDMSDQKICENETSCRDKDPL